MGQYLRPHASGSYDSKHVFIVLLAAVLFLPLAFPRFNEPLRYLIECCCFAFMLCYFGLPPLLSKKRQRVHTVTFLLLVTAVLLLVLSEVITMAARGPGALFLGLLCRCGVLALCYKALIEMHLRAAYAQLVAQVQRSDEALRRERDFFSNVIDAAGGLLVVFDIEGRIVRFNGACEELTGATLDEVLGRPIWEVLYPPDEADSIQLMLADLKCGIFPSYHMSYWDNQFGERRWIAWSSTVLQASDGTIEYVIGSGMDITAQKSLEENLERLTLLDPLTGLYNRRGFTMFAAQQLKLAERMRRSVLLFFCDINHMKEINDQHGHLAGDEALLAAAAALKETFRESDVIGRFGGDEFVVLAVEKSAADPEEVLQRLRVNIDAGNLATQRPLPLALSTGLAHFDPAHPVTLEQLLEQADAAMYREKHHRRRVRAG